MHMSGSVELISRAFLLWYSVWPCRPKRGRSSRIHHEQESRAVRYIHAYLQQSTRCALPPPDLSLVGYSTPPLTPTRPQHTASKLLRRARRPLADRAPPPYVAVFHSRVLLDFAWHTPFIYSHHTRAENVTRHTHTRTHTHIGRRTERSTPIISFCRERQGAATPPAGALLHLRGEAGEFLPLRGTP